MPSVDLNCDLGEGAGRDDELMPLITSANIACGAHAGDEAMMRATVALALKHGVAIGAHPGFADRENFGRRELVLTPGEVHALVLRQIRELQVIGQRQGARLVHVKPHGALYNMAARDAGLAGAIVAAVYEADPRLILVGLAGSKLIEAGAAGGLITASEVFADRSYLADGSLTPRERPDALITDAGLAVTQALRIVREGRVRAADGSDVAIKADTVCLHGDGPQAVPFARELSAGMKSAGIEVRRLA
jgi:UPF0271 protein